MNAKLWIVMLATAVLALGGGAQAVDFYWDGAPDGGGSSADNNDDTGDNWVGDVAPGDNSSNTHIYGGNPAQTTANYNGGATTNDVDNIIFASDLTADFKITGDFRVTNDDPNVFQNSSRAIEIAGQYSNEPNIGGSGTGTLTMSGSVSRFNGSDGVTATINNAGFDILWSGTIGAGNDWWKITKQGAGKVTVSGTWGMIDTDDYGSDHYYLDVDAGTVEVTGTINGSVINVNGGTFKGGSGTVGYYIDGADSDVITLGASGTLNISGLTINFIELTGGVTEDEYVLVDYSAGGTLTTATNGATDDTFFNATNLPAGYSIVNDTANSQIKLVPEPASAVLLGLGGVLIAIRRRRR